MTGRLGGVPSTSAAGESVACAADAGGATVLEVLVPEGNTPLIAVRAETVADTISGRAAT